MKIKKVTIHFWIEKSTSYLFKRYLNWNEETVKNSPKRYDVVQIGNTVKLIYPVAEGSSSIKYYVQKEDIFDVIHDVHLAIGHDGRNRMIKETQRKYKNSRKHHALPKFVRSLPQKIESSKKSFGDQTNDFQWNEF